VTAAERIRDGLMRLPIVALTAFFVGRELLAIRDMVGAHPYFGGDWAFFLALASRVSLALFLVLLVMLHVSRRRPVRKHRAWWPKATALAGLLIVYLLLLLPRAPASPAWDSASTALILAGCVLCILTLFDLGRSLSVMPEARRLVTDGFYRRIRHPLYLFEEIAALGAFLQFRSWEAAGILAVHFYFQLRRMHWEEEILAEAFPEYEEYRGRSHRLVPHVY